jgi:hypothetical protein
MEFPLTVLKGVSSVFAVRKRVGRAVAGKIHSGDVARGDVIGRTKTEEESRDLNERPRDEHLPRV